MQTMIKLIAVLICCNVFMYIAVNFSIGAENERELNKDYNFHFKGDLIDTFMSGSQDLNQIAENTKNNWTDYDVGLNANFTTLPDQQGGTSVGVGGISFLDGLKIVWSFVLSVANIVIAPLTLFFNFRMPVFIGLMIGIPYFIILIFTLFGFIRGVSG
jgi:hypothetical protein